MANFIIVNQPTITFNGTDISADTFQFRIAVSAATQSKPNFSTTWDQQLMGLKSGEVGISFNQNYEASKASALVNAAFGSFGTVAVNGTFGGTPVAGTAVVAVNNVQPVGGAVGDIATQDLTWPTSGTVTGFGLS